MSASISTLLSYPGVRAVFSERFNQNPLESFFGKQRSHVKK